MNKTAICAKIAKEAKDELGWTDGQVAYIYEILSPLGYTDKKYAPKGQDNLTLENLNEPISDPTQPISDERFEELRNSSNDYVPVMAKNELSYSQVEKLSPATREEYFEEHAKEKSQWKTKLHNSDARDDLLREAFNVKTKEEKEKKFAKIPEKSLWGDGLAYHTVNWIADNYETMAKYLRDFGRQIYVFKLEAKLDKETADYLMQEYTNHIIKQFNLCLVASNATVDLFDNVQDEKNRDTLLGWMKKAVDKFLNYGNHGAGEVDFIETGIITFKLQPDNKTILRTSIKTPFTREQVGDKTIVELTDESNQLQIQCPECKLEFNKPITDDHRRDLFVGDLFKRTVLALADREACKAIESAVDNVILVEYKSPQQYLEQELEKKGLKIESKPKVIDAKPTKIKEENIDPDSKVAQAYNILYSRAGRKLEKSEWFSDQA